MRASNVEYHAPARFDDLLEVFVRVARIGRTSVDLRVRRLPRDDDALMAHREQTLVLIDLADGARVPDPLPRPRPGLRGRRRELSRRRGRSRRVRPDPRPRRRRRRRSSARPSRALVERRRPWAGIHFVEGGELVLGPAGGRPGDGSTAFPSSSSGDGRRARSRRRSGDRALLERVAELISPYCLVGWDTGGERWTP